MTIKRSFSTNKGWKSIFLSAKNIYYTACSTSLEVYEIEELEEYSSVSLREKYEETVDICVTVYHKYDKTDRVVIWVQVDDDSYKSCERIFDDIKFKLSI